MSIRDGQGCSDFKTRRHFSGSAAVKSKMAGQDREQCYLDPDFEPGKSSLGSPRASVTSVTSCASTLSTQSGGKDSSKQRYEITKAGLAKFAKRLTSKDKSANKAIHQFPSAIPNIEVTPLRRSGSVDSLLETNLYCIDASDISNCSSMACLVPSCSSNNLSLQPLPHQQPHRPHGRQDHPHPPLVCLPSWRHTGAAIYLRPQCAQQVDQGTFSQLFADKLMIKSDKESCRGFLLIINLISAVISLPYIGQCLENPEVLLEGLPLSKTERKRLEKLNKINIDLQALFVSVEHEHLERARSILSTTDVNVNW
ncbi:uncharacterized protein CEXT_660561 [Caerostris extrusa]|uniref:Uncharacterized protein n=1 Tax=Caerostris extrusa TaxID=172846 RepID=A0AAV4XN80_CAEEX|nr:uncharacterized protein CEXT_660561 [Caerostris extrusa]